MPLRVVSRREWRGEKHPKQYYPVFTPSPYVFLGYSDTDSCHSLESCRRQLCLLQMRMGRISSNADIVYNFLVSSEGVVYEARGWRSRPCLPQKYNKRKIFIEKSYYIGLIGSFADQPPTREMKQALHELLYYGVMNHRIDPRFMLFTVKIKVDRLARQALENVKTGFDTTPSFV